MKLLCISNGHGEDAIALRILNALRLQPGLPEPQPAAQPAALTLAVMPVVGTGESFEQAGLARFGPAQAMPSGGFIYMDGRQLARDVQSGLVSLTLAQIRAARTWAQSGGAIFAVGDVVPLAIAALSGAPYAFLGTAKSEYWRRTEAGPLPDRPWFEGWAGSVYLPWERWLMGRPRCRRVFVRDQLTAQTLSQLGIAAVYAGNPMMDNLTPSPDRQTPLLAGLGGPAALTLVLLPGSRSPEVERNWRQILTAVDSVIETYPLQQLRFLAAIAPTLPLEPLCQCLSAAGWQRQDEFPTYGRDQAVLRLSQNAYPEALAVADAAIAMAGTATEQVVGLGKPAFTFAGRGPQFTRAFAETQARLLGSSVILLEQPQQVGARLQALRQDPAQLAAIAANGRHRLGPAGGCDRIAQQLLQALAVVKSQQPDPSPLKPR